MATESGTSLRNKSLGSHYTLDGFWDFVVERHRIWWKKTNLQQPYPWTDDEILKTYHFCNIFRDLDRGTDWYRANVVGSEHSFSEAVWATIVYRLVNNSRTFEECGLRCFQRESWRWMIQEIRDRKILLNSPAYLTFPWPHKFKGEGSRTDRFEYILGRLELEFDGVVHDLQEAKTLQDVGERLRDIYGVGPFLSLQIYRDLILTGHLDFNENDWVEIGIGAKNTLLHLFGPQARFDKRRHTLIYELAAASGKELTNRGYFEFETRKPNACDIEHCLCEYGKHAKLAAGEGRKRYYHDRV